MIELRKDPRGALIYSEGATNGVEVQEAGPDDIWVHCPYLPPRPHLPRPDGGIARLDPDAVRQLVSWLTFWLEVVRKEQDEGAWSVVVYAMNDDGVTRKVMASSPDSANNAVTNAIDSLRRETGDESWVMNDWRPA